METLKPYQEYKETGLPWVSKIPAHWALVPNRAFLNLKKRTVGSENSKYTLLSLTLRGIIPRDLENAKGKFPSNFDAYQAVQPGDLVFCLFDIDETPRAIGLAREPGMVTGAYTTFSCEDSSARAYLYRLYLHLDDLKALKPLYTGLRKVIKKPTFLGVKSPMPPENERNQIVRFLAHKDRLCHNLIRAKQRLIALLNEQKQAIIQRAVTRGLDPDVPLKPSGVDWLGDVPAHWEVRRLKAAIADHANGIWGDEPDGHNDIICVRVADFDWFKRRVDISNPTLRSVSPSQRSGRLLNPGDLLIEKSGGGDLTPVGRVVLYDHDAPAVCSNFVARIRPRRDVALPGYLCLLFYMLHFAGRNILSIKQTTGIQNLDAGSYFAETVPLPPISEQEAILNEMEVVVNRIDASIKTASDEIILIREYRTRLIADVVTGKLDVRGVVVPEGEIDDVDANMEDVEEPVVDEVA